MGKKCFFCEHDRGPFREKLTVCNECQEYSNFQVKTKMSPRMAYEYEQFKKEEEYSMNARSEELKRAFYLEANSISAILPTMRNHLTAFPIAKELRFIFDPMESMFRCIEHLEKQTRILMRLYEELEDGEKDRS